MAAQLHFIEITPEVTIGPDELSGQLRLCNNCRCIFHREFWNECVCQDCGNDVRLKKAYEIPIGRIEFLLKRLQEERTKR